MIQEIHGYIVITDDTIFTTLYIPVSGYKIYYGRLISELVYEDESGNKKVAEPTDIKGFVFFYRNRLEVMESLSYKNKKMFLHKIVDGAYTLHILYLWQKKRNEIRAGDYAIATYSEEPVPRYFINGIYLPPSKGNMNGLMRLIFPCDKMYHLFQNQKFKYEDTMLLVQYYNNNCH